MKQVVVAALAALALGAFGCTPTPEKTCERLRELADKDSDTPGKKPFELSMSKCLKNMNEMKERDPAAYKCAAKMVSKLSSLDTALLGISVCDKDKPKKSDKNDDEEKAAAKDDDDSSEKPKKKKTTKKASDDE